MIPKIICFLFGHIIREKVATGETWDWINPITSIPQKANYFIWHYLDRCPRCGKVISLNEKQSKKEKNEPTQT